MLVVPFFMPQRFRRQLPVGKNHNKSDEPTLVPRSIAARRFYQPLFSP